MMPFEKPEKNMIFTEQNERKRDFSNVTFLKILLVEKFYFKIWSLVQISIQKLTRSFLNSKSDNLYNFVSKIGRTKSLIQKLTRGEVFDPKLIFCSFSSSSIKPLKKRINRRSSQLVVAWDLVKPVYLVFVPIFLGTDDGYDNQFFCTSNSCFWSSLGSKSL